MEISRNTKLKMVKTFSYKIQDLTLSSSSLINRPRGVYVFPKTTIITMSSLESQKNFSKVQFENSGAIMRLKCFRSLSLIHCAICLSVSNIYYPSNTITLITLQALPEKVYNFSFLSPKVKTQTIY